MPMPRSDGHARRGLLAWQSADPGHGADLNATRQHRYLSSAAITPMTTAESADDLPGDPFDTWFAPDIDPVLLRSLMRRTNLHGIARFVAWIFLCVATGYLVVVWRHSLWVIPATILYGGILSFAYAASHECAHGTAFKTRWLNEAVFW